MATNLATIQELKLISKPTPQPVDKISKLRTRQRQIEQGGGPLRLAKQHASGKLSARERGQS
jgi:acetyl-CoA carboxylase carboxyltransferase component